MRRFHINFEGPEHGWLRIRIQAHGDEIDMTASYTPYDSITELAAALNRILNGSEVEEVHINEEPQESLLRLTSSDQELVIEHVPSNSEQAEPQVTLRVPLDSALREMARKLMFLLEDHGYDRFIEHWHHRPPKILLVRAWDHFKT